MTWVVTQNAATGAFGLLLGSMADRLGNRLSMRLAAFMTILAPLGAVAFAQLEPELGRHWFWLVFIPLGMNPIMLKTTVNYTLEIAPRSEHPRYLSALSLCLAVPFVLSPVVGWLIDATSFELVMLTGAALIALCGASTFLLHEPRHAAFRAWSEVAEIP
jgi:MFS family permease